jgi:hypothetical protein
MKLKMHVTEGFWVIKNPAEAELFLDSLKLLRKAFGYCPAVVPVPDETFVSPVLNIGIVSKCASIFKQAIVCHLLCLSCRFIAIKHLPIQPILFPEFFEVPHCESSENCRNTDPAEQTN